jgi:hypothetical protein
MRMCECGNAVVEKDEVCPDCRNRKQATASPLGPVILWSVITFVVTVLVGIVLQG